MVLAYEDDVNLIGDDSGAIERNADVLLNAIHTLVCFETWSLTLREASRLRVIENRILRRIFGSKRHENGEWRGSTMRNFIVCTVHLIYSG